MAILTPEQLRALPVPPDGYAYIITVDRVLLVGMDRLEIQDGSYSELVVSEDPRLRLPTHLDLELRAKLLKSWPVAPRPDRAERRSV